MKTLVCIGDSHASFFSGSNKIQPEFPANSENAIPNVEGVRLGAVLAYSLKNSNTRSRGREKLFEVLNRCHPDKHRILLCFGEIDCRAHLLRIAQDNSKPITEVVAECVARYLDVINEVSKMGFETYVWNALPTSNLGDNPEYPHFGTQAERNYCTLLFNQFLQEKSQEFNFHFISIFEKLVNKRNETLEYYFFDGIHLGQIAMPFFASKIQRYVPGLLNSSRRNVRWFLDLYRIWFFYKVRKLKTCLKKKLKSLS